MWSVSIITQFGDCNRGYRYPLRIVDGYVTKADVDPTYTIAGAVARSGAIGVTVSGGGQTATASDGCRAPSAGGILAHLERRMQWQLDRRAAELIPPLACLASRCGHVGVPPRTHIARA